MKIRFIFAILTVFTINSNSNAMMTQEITAFSEAAYTNNNSRAMQCIIEGNINEFLEIAERTNSRGEFENASGITSLMLAAAEGRIDIVRLICNSASRDFILQEDSFGKNVIDHAANKGHQEIVEFLIDLPTINWNIVG